MFNHAKILLFSVLANVCFHGCKEPFIPSEKDGNVFICNAEQNTIKDKLFRNNGQSFDGVNLITQEEAYSGNSSVALDETHKYGMTIRFTDAKPGQYFNVSVKRKQRTKADHAILIAKIDGVISEKEYQAGRQLENGWEVLNLEFHVPPHYDGTKPLAFFLMHINGNKVFFDDMKVERFPSKTYYSYQQESISLVVDSSYLAKCKTLIKKAYREVVMSDNSKEWNKAKLIYKGDTDKVQMRLKGDWLDHYVGDKWSFRIKKVNYQGMTEFSLQSPITRGSLYGWVFHQLLQAEDVLATKYDFVPLSVNGKNLGLYAIEEHFLPQLLERNKRSVTPIFRFDEAGFWELMRSSFKSKVPVNSYPYFESSVITPFKIKSVVKDSIQFDYFLKGRELLFNVKADQTDIAEALDLDRFAKLFALSDLASAFHCLAWHNLRFYYNPDSKLIEPIGFDGYTNQPFYNDTLPLVINRHSKDHAFDEPAEFFAYKLLNHPAFYDKYISSLKRFSDSTYIDRFFASIEQELELNRKDYYAEFSSAHFDKEVYYKSAACIKRQLQQLTGPTNYSLRLQPIKRDSIRFFENVGLRCFLNQLKLEVFNYSYLPTKLIGTGSKSKMIAFENNITLGPFKNDNASYSVLLSTDSKYIYYSVGADTTIRKQRILPWKSLITKTIN